MGLNGRESVGLNGRGGKNRAVEKRPLSNAKISVEGAGN